MLAKCKVSLLRLSLYRSPGFRTLSTRIVVVGSVNADVVVRVDRLPVSGETILAASPRAEIIPGGKGANQAVASARLLREGTTSFVCQFGSDDYALMLERELVSHDVDVSSAGRLTDSPSGLGFVFLQPAGDLASIVVAGSNTEWSPNAVDAMTALVTSDDVGAVMIQRECPEHVNSAAAAAAVRAGVMVMQDIGGEDRPIADSLLQQLCYVTPNRSELARLTGMPASTKEQVVAAAQAPPFPSFL